MTKLDNRLNLLKKMGRKNLAGHAHQGRTISSPIEGDCQASDFIGFEPIPLFRNQTFLTQKYVHEGLSIAQIAEQILSSRDAVRMGLIKAGIPVREPHKHNGRPSQCKYGEKIVKGKVMEHGGEKRVIEAVFDMNKQGMSLRQICKFLTQIGVPTKCRGKSWHPEMVRRVLSRTF